MVSVVCHCSPTWLDDFCLKPPEHGWLGLYPLSQVVEQQDNTLADKDF